MQEDQNSTPLTLGQLLQTEREKQKLHLENISRETRISKSILKNLEDDNIEALPQKIYVTGFVKTYAQLLKIPHTQCLDLLDNLYQIDSASDLEEEPENIILNGQKQPKDYKNILIFAVPITLLAILILYFMQSSSSVNNDPIAEEITIESPTKPTLSTTLTVDEPVISTNEPDVLVTPTITPVVTPRPTPPVKTVDTKKEQTADQEEEVKEITFSPLPTTLYQFNDNNIEEELTNIPVEFLKATLETKQNILMKAQSGNSWLTYQIDDGPIHKFVLKQGKFIFLQADLLKIFVGNVNATKIYLNNRLLKISSRSGVKSLVFPKKRAPEFKIPLFIFQKNGKVITSEQYIKEKANKKQ